jgi:hypothetical protein
MSRLLVVLSAVCGALTIATYACFAGGGRCDRCQCVQSCQKVCRVVCEMKEVTHTTWGCKCEDFCVPGPSKRCESGCSCGHCADCRANGWIPTAAYIKTRKVPVKHVEKVLKPSYKLVVEYLCPQCCEASPAK